MTAEEPHTTDNIRIAVYDAADAPTPDAAAEATPRQIIETHNTTRDRYHEEVVGALAGNTPDLTVDSLALGDSTADTANIPAGDPLGNETFRTGVTDVFTNAQTVTIATFIDSTQGVGQNFEEAAVVAEQSNDDLGINRFLISDPGGLLSPKTNNETVTIDITITQEDA
jgi:hypothetical protein